MITEDMINRRFVSGVMHRSAQEIYSLQIEALQDGAIGTTGGLASFLATIPMVVRSEGQTFELRYYTALRFLDIKYRRSKLPLYNRAIWGLFYRHTLPRLRHGLTQDVRRDLTMQLTHALQPGGGDTQ